MEVFQCSKTTKTENELPFENTAYTDFEITRNPTNNVKGAVA